MSFTANPRRGYILGIAAYLTWGMFPLYFKSLDGIPAMRLWCIGCFGRRLWRAVVADLAASGLAEKI